MRDVGTDTRSSVARQQPDWDDPDQVQQVREILAARPPLVSAPDVATLRALLARVATGDAYVMQAGDCVLEGELGFSRAADSMCDAQ